MQQFDLNFHNEESYKGKQSISDTTAALHTVWLLCNGNLQADHQIISLLSDRQQPKILPAEKVTSAVLHIFTCTFILDPGKTQRVRAGHPAIRKNQILNIPPVNELWTLTLEAAKHQHLIGMQIHPQHERNIQAVILLWGEGNPLSLSLFFLSFLAPWERRRN